MTLDIGEFYKSFIKKHVVHLHRSLSVDIIFLFITMSIRWKPLISSVVYRLLKSDVRSHFDHQIISSTCDDNYHPENYPNLHFADTSSSEYTLRDVQCVNAKSSEKFLSSSACCATLSHANLSQCKFINLWWFPDARHLWIKFIVVVCFLAPNALCKCWNAGRCYTMLRK